MFKFLARIILRNRIQLLVVLGLLTVFFLWRASKIELSYEFAKILPENDPDFVAYQNFKKQFGEDGTVMVIGVEDKSFFQLQ